MARLNTAIKIIAVLGGTAEVARISQRTMAEVSRWKRWNRFPPQTYLCLTQALEAKGHVAPPALWGQYEFEPA
jgi:hypothetical protein